METEVIVRELLRISLIFLSFICVTKCVLIIKKAWLEDDQKKMSKGIALLWLGILSAVLIFKMVKG